MVNNAGVSARCTGDSSTTTRRLQSGRGCQPARSDGWHPRRRAPRPSTAAGRSSTSPRSAASRPAAVCRPPRIQGRRHPVHQPAAIELAYYDIRSTRDRTGQTSAPPSSRSRRTLRTVSARGVRGEHPGADAPRPPAKRGGTVGGRRGGRAVLRGDAVAACHRHGACRSTAAPSGKVIIRRSDEE